jgi:glucan biosynthesis protein C
MGSTSTGVRKDAGIETLRGIAILLMVSGHVIGNSSVVGMEVSDTSIWRYLYFTLEPLRMPLFTVLSGFVYSLRPVRPAATGAFLTGKLRRIFVPLVCVGTLQYLGRVMIPGIHRSVALADIWEIYVFPFDQFWFLQALLLVFLCVTVLERRGWLATLGSWSACFGIAFGLAAARPPVPDIFSLCEFIYLLPFFLLGCGIQRFPAFFRDDRVLRACAGVLLAGVTLGQLAWFGRLPIDAVAVSPLGLSVALSGNVLLLGWRRPLPFLPWFGGYSYSIYLLHVFGTAGSRILIHRLGDLPEPAVFTISLFFGLALPIFVDRFLPDRFHLRRVLLGQAQRSRSSRLPAIPGALTPIPVLPAVPGLSEDAQRG